MNLIREFLVGVTGFEPAASWSRRNPILNNIVFYAFLVLFSPINIAILYNKIVFSAQSDSVNGQNCGQPDFAKKRKKIQLHLILTLHTQIVK